MSSPYGFMPQNSETNANVEQKIYRTGIRKRKFVIMTTLNVKEAFKAAWWPSVLKCLNNAVCTRKSYYLSQGYFSQRTAAMTIYNISTERRITK